ncbi:MAG: glycoside hydrolase family 127 protein [Phycisphaerae bacterium]
MITKTSLLIAVVSAYCGFAATEPHALKSVPAQAVTIEDSFWSPKLEVWRSTTLTDVLDKFEESGAFRNFDRVAAGEKGGHEGPPWFDGLIYETIRGASDFLLVEKDSQLEARLDACIARIAVAQAAAGEDGYILTYTLLEEPQHRWGENGGMLRFQHDVYNAGALVEAAVHHYRATGKRNLLNIALRFTNHMCDVMGPAPKKNVVPAHSLPEEALVELYELCRDCPELKGNSEVSVRTDDYLALAQFWIETRGVNCGRPTSDDWDNHGAEAEKFVREHGYDESRPCWGEYAQDEQVFTEQDTLEGHAVRATLFCAGISAAARVNGDKRYYESALRLWENMVGRRMHITGGVGAFAHEEKFGPDYVLPLDAYLETCAAVGAGFFHRNMNLLYGDARYIDELERTLYNNVINGVSLSGTHYYYRNPLSAVNHHRWDWHGCPCCPPMFLKIVSALPGYIYAADSDGLYVNLFIGSEADVELASGKVHISQKTQYPWKGNITIELSPEKTGTFAVNVRVPGWALGAESPFGLYETDKLPAPVIMVNGRKIAAPRIVRGYAVIERQWKKGDKVSLELPMRPRRVYANDKVEADRGRVSFAAGPIVYCAEQMDNENLGALIMDKEAPLKAHFEPQLLGGVRVITAKAACVYKDGTISLQQLRAIPFYAQDNRGGEGAMDVWLAEDKALVSPQSEPTIANQAQAQASHCYREDTISALNDDIEPADSNDHSIPRHTFWDHRGTTEWVEYVFTEPREVSNVSLYFWDDRPAGGECAVPQSWRVLYNADGQWKEVQGNLEYKTEKDKYNRARFEPVKTNALRIEVKSQDGFSSGILEWKVE